MLSNADIKYLSSLHEKKFRDKENKFLIEGFHLAEECLKSDYKIEYIVLREDADLHQYPEIEKLIIPKKLRIEILNASKFKKISETVNSQGIICLVRKPDMNEKSDDNLIVALDGVSDPGNLGTILRTCYWFSCKAILTGNASADVYNSKVLRSSQGANFHVSVLSTGNFSEYLQSYKNKGFEVISFSLSGSREITNFKFKTKSLLVFGSEANGISDEILELSSVKLKINSYSNCESLNVASSVSIGLYEYTRQLKIV